MDVSGGKVAHRDERTHAIIGAAMEVHRRLGHGFLEAVYQEALAIEMASRGIPFRREVEFPIHYRDAILACRYKADFLCHDAVIVELKALAVVTSAEQSQVLNCLRAANAEVGLLLNFGTPCLQHKRLVFTTVDEDDVE